MTFHDLEKKIHQDGTPREVTIAIPVRWIRDGFFWLWEHLRELKFRLEHLKDERPHRKV